MSCSDILLSFLQDAGEDWADSFIFPEVDSNELMPVDFLTAKAQDFDSFESRDFIPSPASASSEATFASSEENNDFDLDDLDIFQVSDEPDSDFTFSFDDQAAIQLAVAAASKNLPTTEVYTVSSSQKKRKACSDEYCVPQTNSHPKANCKAVVDGKIASVVCLLKQYKVAEKNSNQEKRVKKVHHVSLLETTQAYLEHLLGIKPMPPADLLRCANVTSVLSSKSLSSFVSLSQSKHARQRLTAWAPLKNSAFPEVHTGIGQVSAASRGFSSAIRDLISPSIIEKLTFSVQIDAASVISVSDKLSASFSWRSVGVTTMGFPQELEFNGLIRCSFVPEGLADATVLFDACKLVRQTEMMFQPMSVSSSLL